MQRRMISTLVSLSSGDSIIDGLFMENKDMNEIIERGICLLVYCKLRMNSYTNYLESILHVAI